MCMSCIAATVMTRAKARSGLRPPSFYGKPTSSHQMNTSMGSAPTTSTAASIVSAYFPGLFEAWSSPLQIPQSNRGCPFEVRFQIVAWGMVMSTQPECWTIIRR